MTTQPKDRFVINSAGETTHVVITLGDTELTVKMPAVSGAGELSEESQRQAILRQLRRALDVAREEIG